MSTFRRCSHVMEGRSGAKPSYALVELSMHVVNCVCLCVQYKGVQLKFRLQHTGNCDRPQYEHTAVCVIAQQYSSVTLILLRFDCRKEKCGALFRNVISLFYLLYFFFFFVPEFLKSESVCTFCVDFVLCPGMVASCL